MAGMGPPPKDPKLRQRKNRISTAAVLSVAADGRRVVEEKSTKGESSRKSDPAAPAHAELPKRGPNEKPWHLQTLSFWEEVWASPMAAEFIAADVPGLIILAELVDAFNYGETSLAAEIRLQRQCFGLTPLDRRRLQWEIERADAAQRRRPAAGQAATQPVAARDPRRTLRAVK